MKTTSLVLYLIFSVFMLNACSAYKSQGRKQFESDAATNSKVTTTSFELKSCHKQNALAAWLQAEFPTRTYELIAAEPELEIWKSRADNGKVEIRATQISETERTTCTYQFANELVWHAYQQVFLEELRNNMMMAD